MIIIAFFVLAVILSSLIEYWAHRSMHTFPWFGSLTSHYKHHYEESFGVLQDFKSYSQAALVFCPLFFVSWSAGIGAILGGLAFAAFAAYTHQLQHEHPAQCFWMKVPVHYLHHKYSCRCNYGLSIDVWDRVFGTYRPQQWLTDDKFNSPRHSKTQVVKL
ncbi:MAG: sterol desaturase family protein [Cyanophyceae cyanobacterium]